MPLVHQILTKIINNVHIIPLIYLETLLSHNLEHKPNNTRIASQNTWKWMEKHILQMPASTKRINLRLWRMTSNWLNALLATENGNCNFVIIFLYFFSFFWIAALPQLGALRVQLSLNVFHLTVIMMIHVTRPNSYRSLWLFTLFNWSISRYWNTSSCGCGTASGP